MAKSNYLTNNESPDGAHVLLTLKCNSKCDHCYLEAGPERTESMPMPLRKRVIDEVARNKIREIAFSGGEPTVEMDKLIDTLKHTSETHQRTGYPKKIWLQTNAYFLRGCDENEIKEKLEALKYAGANRLSIGSGDSYHDIGIDELHKINNIAKKIFDYVEVKGANEKVVPIGRAVNRVPKKQWKKRRQGDCLNGHRDFVDVSVDGSVYSCCWQTAPIGNLANDPLSKILKQARRPESIFRKLSEKNCGFSGMEPEELEISKEKYENLMDEFGTCGACHQFFKERKDGQK